MLLHKHPQPPFGFSPRASLWLGTLLSLALAPLSQAQMNVSVTTFGAQADGILRTDGAMNAGSAILTSASASFTATDTGKYMQVIGAGPGGTTRSDAIMAQGSANLSSPSGVFNSADVGRGIIVIGAGAGGSNLITTIVGYNSNGSVVLGAPALTSTSNAFYYYGAMTLEGTIQSVINSTSVILSSQAAATITGATYAYGTDNHAAFQSALDTVGQAGGGTVNVPQPASCAGGAVCGYVVETTDQMTAHAPGSVKIRFNNVSLIGAAPQTNLFCRGAWATYYNSAKFPGQTATIRGNCVAIGDDGGPRGVAGEYTSNATVANLHLYGMTNGNTYNYSYSPTDPPLTTTGDGWDETNKAIYLWENASETNIVINNVYLQDFKGENIYSGGSVMTGIVISNSTMKNFNGDGISMLAADLQVLNNNISNGSNAGIENSTVANTSAALVRQLYQGNTISNFPRVGLVIVGVDSGTYTGNVQILNNYFDTIAQTDRSGAMSAIYLASQCCGGDVAPSNVTISGNTCHDCFSFGNLETSGTTTVSNNTMILDQLNGDAFLYFTFPMTNFTISGNTGYRTAAGTSAGRTLNSVYSLNPGYVTGNFQWNDVLVENNSWNLPGTPNFLFVTTSGPGWSLVTAKNVIWNNETCSGCTYPDINHGVWNLAANTTIEPYGPVMHVNGNTSAVNATLDASKELDGSNVQIVNSGVAPVTFNSDRNLTLSSPVTLNPAGGSATFHFNGGTGTFSILSGISVAVTPPAATLGVGQTAQFSATVTGSSNQQVTWSITPAGVGSVSSSGLYTAPASIASVQTITVQATTNATPTVAGAATVTLTPVTVSMNPTSASLDAGQSVQLAATVVGTSNQQVTWSLSPAGIGAVSTSGLYVAPASVSAQQTVTATATSAADATKSAAAVITLYPAVTLSVTPPTASLTANQSVQLTANVTGGFTQQVTWSLSPAGTGTVSTSGLYVAPTSISSQQTVTVTATSVADATKSAAVVITLTPPTTVSVSPSSASLNVNQALQLTATVTGATNKLVTWTVSGAGSVSTSGLYTAPSVITAQQTVTVTATSAADSTKSASSIVTLVPLTVSLNLAGASLGGAQSQQFAATVTGSANQQVSWSIVPAGLGSISAAGLYTAPALVTSQQTVTVLATSTVDLTRSASAIVTLYPVALSLTPGSAVLLAGQTAQFAASVSWTNNPQVSWSSSPAGVGGVSATGIYTAPATVSTTQTVTLLATSLADATKIATATVTLSSGTGYAYQRTITIAHGQVSTADQNNFPVMIKGVYPFLATAANGGHVQNANGYDITFSSDNAGLHPLNWELEKYDPATGTVAIWVQVPTASHLTDTVFYMNYGNPATVSFLGNKTATWDSNFMAVYHMSENAPTGIVGDSTSNANNGAAQVNTSVDSSVGENGSALRFNGSSDYVNAGKSSSLSLTGPLTLEGWVNLASWPNNGYGGFLLARGQQYFIEFTTDNSGFHGIVFGTYYASNMFSGTPLPINSAFTGAFHHVAGTWDGQTWSLYLDGVLQIQSNSPLGPGLSSEAFTMGGQTFSGGFPYQYLNGVLDEVRVSSSPRSAGWIATEYHNQSQPSAFYTLGTEQAGSPGGMSVSVTPPTGAITAGQTLQLTASVAGSSNQQVTWSVTGVGSVSTSGLYTAPASMSSQQSVTVTATSAADATKTSSAVVTVNRAISISVTPPTGAIAAGQTLQLTATVSGSSNQQVTWSVSGVGSVSTSGLYTAPASVSSQQSVTVTATSAADATKTSSAVITVNPVISVSVTPPTGAIAAGQTLQLTASVSGSSNQQVTWSVTGVGTVSASGLYTAPASMSAQQSVTVTATSAADVTKTSSAVITVNPVISVSVAPPNGAIAAGQTLQLTASVSGSSNQQVTWSVTGVGSVSTSGLYTAPASMSAQQSVTVTATSAADVTKTSSAVITVNPVISVSVTPPTGAIAAGQTLQLTATVSGSSNQQVAWSVSGVGSVSTSGLYTAPASVSSQQSVTVTATSAADATKTATVSIVITPVVPQASTCGVPGLNSWTGCYYEDPSFSTLGFTRTDQYVQFNWPANTVIGNGVGPQNFSVQWQGNFNFQYSWYYLYVTSNDTVRLYVDGVLAFDSTTAPGASPYKTPYLFSAGQHLITVDYVHSVGAANINVAFGLTQ